MFTDDEKNPRPSGNSTEGEGNYVAAGAGPQHTDVTALSPAAWAVCMEYYSSGYTAGLARGRQYEHDEVATLQREAARIVHAMAGIPARDAEADRARRERIDARWSK